MLRKIGFTLLCGVLDAAVFMTAHFLMVRDLNVFNQQNWITAGILGFLGAVHFWFGYSSKK